MVTSLSETKREATEDPKIKAQTDALRLISYQPRSVSEVRMRLKQKKHAPALVEEVIENLKKKGFLDDAKFAKLYANNSVSSRPAGKRRLEMELKRKGLSPEHVATAMDSVKDTDEKEVARDLVRRRFEKMTGLPPEKKKARLFGFLKRRGFTDGAIYAALKDLFEDVPEE